MDFLRETVRQTYGSQVSCYSVRGGEMWREGKWTVVPKEEIKRRFRDGEIKILLCTESASEGLNLQTCGVLINYDMPWNPMRVEQRIGRIDRIGQAYSTVRIHNFYYDGTVEAKVYRKLRDRIDAFSSVVGNLQPILAQVPTFIAKAMESVDSEEEDVLLSEFEAVLDAPPRRPALEDMVKMDVEADLKEIRKPLPAAPMTAAGIQELFVRSHLLKAKAVEFSEMDSQFLLILSSCHQDDPEEDLKIAKVSAELDRFFSLLQLQNAYESNVFGNTIYRISAEIRDQPASAIRSVFDTHLMQMLSNRRSTEVSEPFQYTFFKSTGINLNARFKRYFFARVERFLCEEANKGMSHPVKDLVSKTGYVNGFHIEHILSHNEANHALFGSNEDVFEQERNRLGGLLLLKGKDNVFSSNELYSEKVKTYANTLYWNATLHADTYKANGDLDGLKQRHDLDMQAYDAFGPEQLEARQRLLFKVSSILWA